MMNEITEALGLGQLLSGPQRITGGLLHRMDRIHCESGFYALKTLNPQIMKRPEAMEHMVHSERIARELKSSVPVVHAIEIGGDVVFSLNGKHYMLYPWMEGESVFPPNITAGHCAVMGDMLGRMHKADVQVDGVKKNTPEEVRMNWALLPKDDAELAMLFEHRAMIAKWQSEANESVKALSFHQVISHRDLDPKNVLWQGKMPLIIDWEAAGYMNPWQEMMETAFYWADDGKGSLDESLFKAFATAYGQHVSLTNVCWKTVFAACFQGMLGWLYYNVRRGCGLENADDEDKKTGMQQVQQTLIALKAMDKKIRLAEQWLKDM